MVNLNVNLVKTNGVKVVGRVRSLDLAQDSIDWFIHWFPQMRDLNGDPLYEDSHWDVPEIWNYLTAHLDYKIIVLEAENKIQAYAIIQLHNYLGIDKKPCVYLSFLSSAPWNRRQWANPEFKNIGKLLVSVCSLEGGKVLNALELELHSLPAAENFYLKINFQRTGLYNDEGLNHFRLEKQQALRLIAPLLPIFVQNGGVK